MVARHEMPGMRLKNDPSRRVRCELVYSRVLTAQGRRTSLSPESYRSLGTCQGGELNSRPRAYESPALPLSYPGKIALAKEAKAKAVSSGFKSLCS